MSKKEKNKPFVDSFQEKLKERGYSYTKKQVLEIYHAFIDTAINDYLVKMKVLRLNHFVHVTPVIMNFKGLKFKEKSKTDGKYINLQFKKSERLTNDMRNKLIEMIKYNEENK